MALSVAIVGLPNVGKSTLFNALLKKQMAYVANFPFATIEPNIGIVPVPDERLVELSKIYNAPIVNATVEFVDIAGLIEGASKGEGLGNKFLNHIRQTDAICFVLRAFSDPDVIWADHRAERVKQGVKDPKSDLEILKLELELADSETMENHMKKKNANPDELPLFKKKPFLVVLNVDEGEVSKASDMETKYADELGINRDQVIAISAKVEAELSELPENDQKEYLEGLGVNDSGLTRLIQKAFKTLGLITFLTAGEKEVRAWTIKEGITAQEASGVIHTDFMNKFIKADTVSFVEFIKARGWKPARENGKVKSEGRDYVVKDGDVIEFKIGS